jgi:hypothetical protein
MRLDQPLVQLPISFCEETLAAEVRALPASAWLPHPTGFVGNEAVPLVTPDGTPNDWFEGPMAPTESLRRCPYMMELMAEIGAVWGRGRLMALAPGAEVPPHVDCHYYWRTHHRLHIPVITNPGVRFTCGGETVHMAAGECWMFDSFRWHEVHNQSTEQRVHLVIDTVGGGRLFELMEAAQSGASAGAPRKLLPGERSGDGLAFEQVNVSRVMSPWEIRCHIAFLAEYLLPDPRLDKVMKRIGRFADDWAAAWAQFGTADEGFPIYRQLIAAVRQDLDMLDGPQLLLQNDMNLCFALEQLVFSMAVAPTRAKTLVATQIPGGNRRLAS